MRFPSTSVHARWLTLALPIFLTAAPVAADDPDVGELRKQLEALAAQNRALQATVESLADEVREARDEARAARDERAAASVSSGLPQLADEPRFSLGRANLQLLDLSLDVLWTAGASSASNEELELLQGGDHDPRRRGFSLPQIELGFQGAVDPFFTAQSYLIYFQDPEGESRFEIEEASVTTEMLPFGLHERGLQLEIGQFFTEFGRLNPRHPHQWHWLDQPVVLTRFLGEDGIRNPGIRAGWLAPLPWFSELHVGLQDATGETMVSFLASDEVFEERAIGARPFAGVNTSSSDDLVKLLRWVNGFDLSDAWSGELGISALHGPNATGHGAETWIYGADVVLKWRPLASDRGWPFVVFEAEWLRRSYEVDRFSGCPEEEDDGLCPVPEITLGDTTLRDQGLFAQLLWGFRRGWSLGLRYEYANGDGGDFDVGTLSYDRDEDPFRDDRHRLSPLLVFHPSEFSRLRVQYSYDDADHLADDDAHSVWLGLEFLFGAHPAHSF